MDNTDDCFKLREALKDIYNVCATRPFKVNPSSGIEDDTMTVDELEAKISAIRKISNSALKGK